jgi:two-component sensor histidine kinase
MEHDLIPPLARAALYTSSFMPPKTSLHIDLHHVATKIWYRAIQSWSAELTAVAKRESYLKLKECYRNLKGYTEIEDGELDVRMADATERVNNNMQLTKAIISLQAMEWRERKLLCR